MNVFTFSGRLGKDAEVKATQGGTTVCTFSVAVESGYGDKKQTTWTRCALFGKRAEGGLPQYLTKGAQVVVSGEATLREYQKQDGSHGASLEVRVNELTLVGSKQEGGYQQQGYQQPAQQVRQELEQQNRQAMQPAGNSDISFDDDIPF